MLDLGHLYNTSNRSIQYFSTPGSWVTWNKPRYCSFIRILCIGAGGGGGQGGTITSNGFGSYYASGGGGGGSGAMTYVIIPANLLPDILYVFCALGSTGAGGASYVSVAPNNSGIYTVCAANGGTAGGSGVGLSGSASGGSGGSASSASSLILGSVYAFTYAGDVGSGAFPGSAGYDVSYPTTGILLSGGAGGGGYFGGSPSGGTTYSGGYINAPASQTSVYNIFQTITTSGSNGIELYKPLLSTGGSGGGSGGSSNGGAGGFGSGGGGASHSTYTNSRGGNGLVIIQTW